MIATRFRSVVWTGGICVAALSFYMVSQTVAAKRAELASVEGRIVATHREIRTLETEIGTRAGMAQIENWNSRVYGLQAPGAAQFVNSSVQLVAMAQPQPLPLDPAIAPPRSAVQQASLNLPVAPVTAPPPVRLAESQPVEQPMVRQATFVQAKPQAMAPTTASAVHEVVARKPAKAQMKLTALDDAWLAEATGEPAGRSARKVRP